jgi:hypothetical protein
MPRDQFEDVFQQHLQPFGISGLYASISRYDEDDFAVLESSHPDREVKKNRIWLRNDELKDML